MLKRFLIVLFIFGIALAAVVQWVLPPVASRVMTNSLTEVFGTSQGLEAKLESYPNLKMLLGQFDTVKVTAKEVNLGGILVDEMTTVISNLNVNFRELLLKRQLVWSWQRNLETTIKISEVNLNKGVWAGIDQVINPHIDLQDGKAVITGSLRLIGRDLALRIEGNFAVVGGAEVSFEPTSVTLGDVAVSQELLGLVRSFRGLVLSFDLSRLDPPLTPRSVEVHDGHIIIKATTP